MNKNDCRLERVSNVTVGFVLRLIVRCNRDNRFACNRPPDCCARIGPCRDIFGITPQQGLLTYCPKNTRCDKQLSKLRRDELSPGIHPRWTLLP